MSTEAKVGAFVLELLRGARVHGDLPSSTRSSVAALCPTALTCGTPADFEPGASVLYGGINVGKVTAVRPWADRSNPNRNSPGSEERHSAE